ncbi:hypothetical protein [Rhizobium sp. 007]|uniref:hypothetical protein n=1 Tax=Rhizobium sp. 007 TaxID=2785056 RepID=UPI00188FD82E|nr:hypothetical protein [Rhizobium sp. 007]QPB22223.1 hypothetical protein ISN39_21395 [Rhizobium sp. 007]
MSLGLSANLSFNAIVLAEGGISQATRFDKAASPGYIDGDDYVGGFDVDQLEELMDFLPSNRLGWCAAIASNHAQSAHS